MTPTPPAQFHEPIPPPFLYVRVQDLNLTPTITALCAGYEGGEWRAKALADHMMEWLPEFALNYTERKNCGHHNSVRLLREAAQRVYKTEKFQKGASSANSSCTSPHVVFHPPSDQQNLLQRRRQRHRQRIRRRPRLATADALELWVGEVKFYSDIDQAIKDVAQELGQHTRPHTCGAKQQR